MSNATANASKKKLEQVFALWKRRSKEGKVYFSGKDYLENKVTAFYNTEKKNLKEPDMRVYLRDDEGNLSKEPLVSLWCNATKNGKKVLSGKIDGKRVVGFINTNADENHPYISVYWGDEPQKQEATEEKPKATKATKKKAEQFEEVSAPDDLPF